MSHSQKSKALVTSNTLSDVYKAVGYSRRAGVQAIQQLVPRKYRMRLGDVKIYLQGVLKSEYLHPDTVLVKEPSVYRMRLGDVNIDLDKVGKSVHLHPDTVLLKEPGVYCFLLRCNKACSVCFCSILKIKQWLVY